MIRYPKGYLPGIPTLSADERKRWMFHAMNGSLERYLQARGDLNITEGYLRENANEIGLTRDEFDFHFSHAR